MQMVEFAGYSRSQALLHCGKVDNMTQKPRRSGAGGFTLIELMVLLAVMGILAAVVGVGVVRTRAKRATDAPFGGLRTVAVGDTYTGCDISEVERLKRLSPEGRKAIAPPYAERLQKDQERKEALEARLKDLEAEEATLRAQPKSAERSKKIREFGEVVSRTLGDLETVERFIKSDTECLDVIEADAPPPVPSPPSPVYRSPVPTLTPRAPARTPVKTVPSSPSAGGVVSTPVPTQKTAPAPGIEPPSQGPYDTG